MPSNNVTYVTEFGFSDLLKVAKGAASFFKDTKKETNNRKMHGVWNMSSIAQASKSLTMSFPVLCSDTITPATAAMITKAVERNNSSMLQMLIAAYHIQADNGLEAIQMIHTNLDNSFRAEDLIDAMCGVARVGLNAQTATGAPGALSGTYRQYFENASNYYKEQVATAGVYLVALEECTRDFLNSINKTYPESSFSESAITDFCATNRFGDTTVLREARYGGILGTFDPEAEADARAKAADRAEEAKRKRYQQDYENAVKGRYDAIKVAHDQNSLINDTIRTMHSLEVDRNKAERDKLLDRRDLFTKQLLDSDVKKANELQPTLMVIPFYYEDGTGNERSQEFIAGVKSRLITCTSNEIIDQISRINKQGVNLNNLVRATTKEISFAKEFLGGIEQAKIDAKKDSKLSKTNPIWRTLQARSSRSGINRLRRISNTKNAAAAITTLVMTIQEADYIAENFGVDITNPVIAREFMENYNLLCLVIVDEQTEVAKFIYDGEMYFTDYSFNSLERDNSANDTRKLISLLNKTR